MVEKKKYLYLFIEGYDDSQFFTIVILPKLKEKYDTVKPFSYSQTKKEIIANTLKSCSQNSNKTICFDYLYITDLDEHPCIQVKKEKLKNQYPFIDEQKIMIVKAEIESWYYAGINESTAKSLGIKSFQNIETSKITKELFNNAFNNKDLFLKKLEILEKFDIVHARKYNKSFDYFCRKYLD
jgi:hypothetical protein